MVAIQDVRVDAARSVRVYDSGAVAAGGPTVLWHHESPHTGAPLAPLLAATAARGMRLLCFARPGYGGSPAQPGRTVAAAAADALAVIDALGIERIAVMGGSGGGPHALACAALLPTRTSAAITLAGVAPFAAHIASPTPPAAAHIAPPPPSAAAAPPPPRAAAAAPPPPRAAAAAPRSGDTIDWFAGMADPGALRAALAGPAARRAFDETAEFDPASFNALDYAALEGGWAALAADVEQASRGGASTQGMIDDDLAFVRPWGFELSAITAPVLLVQGGDDRVIPPSHAEWMQRHLPAAELWRRPADGHIAVLDAIPAALDWLLALRR